MSGDHAERHHGEPVTNQSLIRRAGSGSASDRAALEQWLRIYGPVLETHLRFRWKATGGTEAADLLHLFLSKKVLEGNLLVDYDPARGRFRTWLLTALDRFVIDQWRKVKNAPASGRDDELDRVPAAPASDVFDVAWAMQVIVDAIQRMRAYCQVKGRADLWSVFEGRVLATLQGLPPVSYRLLAEHLGLESEKSASNLHVTVERRFRAILREIIGEYAPDAIDEELLDLREILEGAGAELVESIRIHLWSPIPEVTVSSTDLSTIDPRALAKVLGREHPPGEPGALLHQLLTGPLPFDSGNFGPEWTVRSKELLGDEPLPSLADLFRYTSPPPGLLGLVKEFAKDNRRDPDSLLPREVSTLLYFASIAVALSKDQGRITRHSDESLRHGFEWALAQPWVDEATRALFHDGLRHLAGGEQAPSAEGRGA